MNLIEILNNNSHIFFPVINFNAASQKIIALDFTENNKELAIIDLSNTAIFSQFIKAELQKNNAIFGIGGYNENRILYKRSALFDGTQNRTIHLGVDVWGNEKTPIYTPLDAIVHSFAYNNNFGDYGSTIILQHQIDNTIFHTLYGHLSLADIENLYEGQIIKKGELFAHFGNANENGNWPPHLHFQIIENMEGKKGDYPGVCTIANREKYLANCPDANLILGMM